MPYKAIADSFHCTQFRWNSPYIAHAVAILQHNYKWINSIIIHWNNLFYFLFYYYRKLDRSLNGRMDGWMHKCVLCHTYRTFAVWKSECFSLFQVSVIPFLFYWMCQKLNKIRAKNWKSNKNNRFSRDWIATEHT